MSEDRLALLGKKIHDARVQNHMTQVQLSEKSCVSVRQIAKIEKGVMNPSYEILYALIECLNLSANNLFQNTVAEDEEYLEMLKAYYLKCPAEKRISFMRMAKFMAEDFWGS